MPLRVISLRDAFFCVIPIYDSGFFSISSFYRGLLLPTLTRYISDLTTPFSLLDWILRALLLAVTSLWPHKVGSRVEIY